MVRLIAALMIVASVVACGGSARFSGDGYSVQIPTNPEFTYSHETDNPFVHDTWVVKTQTTEGLVVEVTDPLPSSWPTTLDGALARAQQMFALMDYPDPTVTAVNLPAGAAYQLDGTGSLGATRMYALYNGGKYYVVDCVEMPAALSDQIINSFTLQ